MAQHNDLGHWGEGIAEQYLQSRGFDILYRNYQLGRLEIDLVARQSPNILVVVEVKTRTSDLWQDPIAAVDRKKQRHLIRAGHRLAQRLKTPHLSVRFDLIAVVGHPSNYHISHIEDAFYPF